MRHDPTCSVPALILVVAGEVDRRDAGALAFVDHEGDADAVALHLLGARPSPKRWCSPCRA